MKYNTPELLQVGSVPEIVLGQSVGEIDGGSACMLRLSILDVD